MAFVSTVATVIGGALSMYASVEQGKAAEKHAEYQARVTASNALQQKMDSRTNAQTAKVNRKSALLEASEQRRRVISQSKRNRAKFTANLSRQGITLGAVSLEDSLKSIEARQESQAQESMYEGALAGRNFRMQEAGMLTAGDRAVELGRSQSSLMIIAGRNNRRSANLTALGTGISTIGSVAEQIGKQTGT